MFLRRQQPTAAARAGLLPSQEHHALQSPRIEARAADSRPGARALPRPRSHPFAQAGARPRFFAPRLRLAASDAGVGTFPPHRPIITGAVRRAPAGGRGGCCAARRGGIGLRVRCEGQCRKAQGNQHRPHRSSSGCSSHIIGRFTASGQLSPPIRRQLNPVFTGFGYSKFLQRLVTVGQDRRGRKWAKPHRAFRIVSPTSSWP